MYYTSFIHKTKLKTLLLSLIVSSSSLLAQNEPIIIDTTFLKCEYATNYYTDTLKFKDAIWFPDEFILEIGTKASKFYSKRTNAYEQMLANPEIKEAYFREFQHAIENKEPGERLKVRPLARHSPLVIYSNYPQGKKIIQDAAFFDYYIFEDDNLPQQWTMISDSVKAILGYTCHKATCSYRGRNYEAWYAIDLPVNAGPWKFSGLPGLIMSVQDTKGHYTFEIKGLMKAKEPIEYIEYSNRKYSHTDRKTFLRTNAKSLQIGLVRYLEANAPEGSSNSDFKQWGGGAKYDLLERDY